jgi:hypothetical protein
MVAVVSMVTMVLDFDQGPTKDFPEVVGDLNGLYLDNLKTGVSFGFSEAARTMAEALGWNLWSTFNSAIRKRG